MSRLRYIAQNARGPRGAENDVRTTFSSPDSARRNLQPRGGRVLILDLDELLPLDATDEERYQHAERMLFHYTQEEQRLRPALHGNPTEVAVRVNAALSAAREWRRDYERRCNQKTYKPTRAEVLLFHAMIGLDDGQTCMCGKAEHPDGCEEWCDGGK